MTTTKGGCRSYSVQNIFDRMIEKKVSPPYIYVKYASEKGIAVTKMKKIGRGYSKVRKSSRKEYNKIIDRGGDSIEK